jgi:DNA-binding transcriptional LysR family regulator
MNLDIDALRAFVAVADQRSFTRAASSVSRTQSTVSVQIKNLEARLGFALFERTKRSVAMTPRGERLLAYARGILRLNDEGVRDVTAAQVQGRVRLGITEYFAPEHLPTLLTHFCASYPTVDIEVTTGVTGMLRAMQKAGELDVVIGRRDPGGTEGEPIRREPVRWVSAGGYRLGPKAPVGLALLPVGCGIRAMAIAALERQHRQWRPVYCGPSVLGVQSAVAAGLAVACLTRSAVREDFRVLGAREGLPKLPDSEIVLFAPRRAKGSELRQLVDVIRDHFAQPPSLPVAAAAARAVWR